MTQLLAAHAPDIIELVLVLILLHIILVLILFALVRPNFATWSIFSFLATAPPDIVFLIINRWMRPADPLEVLFLGVFFLTLLALFHTHIIAALPVFNSLDLELLPLVLLLQVRAFLFVFHELIDLFFEIHIGFIQFLLQLANQIFRLLVLHKGLILNLALGI